MCEGIEDWRWGRVSGNKEEGMMRGKVGRIDGIIGRGDRLIELIR